MAPMAAVKIEVVLGAEVAAMMVTKGIVLVRVVVIVAAVVIVVVALQALVV